MYLPNRWHRTQYDDSHHQREEETRKGTHISRYYTVYIMDGHHKEY